MLRTDDFQRVSLLRTDPLSAYFNQSYAMLNEPQTSLVIPSLYFKALAPGKNWGGDSQKYNPYQRIGIGCWRAVGIDTVGKNVFNAGLGNFLIPASGNSPVMHRAGFSIKPQINYQAASSVIIGFGFDYTTARVRVKGYNPYVLFVTGPSDPAQLLTQTIQNGAGGAVIDGRNYQRNVTDSRRGFFFSVTVAL